MRKWWKIVAVAAAVALLVIGVSLFSVYQASQQVPAFYREAVSRASEEQEKGRDEFVVRMTGLASDLHRAGRWQCLFTADQINAWLALELATNYPNLLPSELHDPRIAIHDRAATIACRYEGGNMAAVLSLTVEPYLKDPHVLALRIRGARAGSVPVPLAQVLDGISHAARQLNLRLEWRKTHGDPVALISFSNPRTEGDQSLKLEAVELRDNELFLAGAISRGGPNNSPIASGKTLETPAEIEPAASDAQPLLGAAIKETRQK